MKTHLFKVNQLDGNKSLGELLQILEQQPLLMRNRSLGGFDNRIEVINFEKHDGVDCAMVNFVKLRMDHGPGRASLGEPTEGFDLATNQGFAEETAAIFDLEHGHVVAEYNHHGARVSSLQDYVNRIISDLSVRFELLPVLDQEVMRKLARFNTLSRFEIKVAPGKLDPSLKSQASSMLGVLDVAETFDAPSITVTLGGLPGNLAKLDDKIWDVVNSIREIITKEDSLPDDNQRGIKTLKVTGKDSADGHPEMLDLINGRVYNEHEMTAGVDRRFSWEDRLDALRRDHIRWRDLIR